MARPGNAGTLRPLISRTISETAIPKKARPMRARNQGLYPQLVSKVRALRPGMVEEVEFETERQATVVCAKLRHYAKRMELSIDMSRHGAVCYFKKGT